MGSLRMETHRDRPQSEVLRAHENGTQRVGKSREELRAARCRDSRDFAVCVRCVMSIFRRIKNKLTRSQHQQDVNAELQTHIEMRIADAIAAGMSPEEARRDALIRFGNQGVVRERVTEADPGMAWDSLVRDLLYAARQLRRTPAFTFTALVTLILAIRANGVAFSVLNALILKPQEGPASAGLYTVVHQQPGYDNHSYPDYLDFKNKNSTFRDMATYRLQRAGLAVGDAAYSSWYI